jgi:Zn-dependent protease with chaperone function
VVLLLRRLINRPGGLSSGILLTLPLALPLIVAVAWHGPVLPEIAVLRPAADSLINGSGRDLFDMLLFSDKSGAVVVPYALWGSPGPWLLIIGASASAVMLLRRGLGMIAIRRLVARCRPLEDTRHAYLAASTGRLIEVTRIYRRPEVLVLPSGVSGAFVTAGRSPRLLLSEDLLDSLTRDELEGVMAHELAHIEARDVLIVLMGGLLRDVVAWNPIGHLAFRRLTIEREFEADRRAASLTGKPLAVASGLLKVYELSRRPPFATNAALSAVRRRGNVCRRVSRLIALADGRVPMGRPLQTPFVAAACLAAVLALQMGARLGEESEAAFAFVLGAPRIESTDVWGAELAPKFAATKSATSKKAGATPTRAQILRRRMRTLDPHLTPGMGVKTKDLDLWVHETIGLAKRQGILGNQVRAEMMEGWQAVPVYSGPFSIYRIERDPVETFFRAER